MSGAGFQLEIGPTGVSQVPPDFLVGTTPSGWLMQLSTRQLIVRHQQRVVERRRTVAPNEFPTREQFCAVVAEVLAAVPESLVGSARRMQLTINYAMFTHDYPASVISEMLGQGRRTPVPVPERTRFIQSHQETEFESVDGRQYVWNETTRVGNWLAPDDLLRVNSAVVRTFDLRNAAPESAEPLAEVPTIDSLPVLSREDLRQFFSSAGEGPGLPALLERLRSSLRGRYELHE
jgi:hypothetical protein